MITAPLGVIDIIADIGRLIGADMFCRAALHQRIAIFIV